MNCTFKEFTPLNITFFCVLEFFEWTKKNDILGLKSYLLL